MMLGEANEAVASGLSFEVLHLVFALFFWKAYEPL